MPMGNSPPIGVETFKMVTLTRQISYMKGRIPSADVVCHAVDGKPVLGCLFDIPGVVTFSSIEYTPPMATTY